MRTLLNNIKYLEDYLEGKLDQQESLVAQAWLLSNPVWKMNFYFQRKAYAIIKAYHRKKLKEETKRVGENLLNDPGKIIFQQTIIQLFK